MGLPQEVMNEVFQVIEGGSELGEPAKIIQFTSDNGQKTWNAVQQTAKDSNGTGFNYWVLAFETLIGEVATAVSAGAAMLTMEVGAFGLACAPALGILQGVLLYNLTPEFWDDVAQRLIDAGETINRKVVFYVDKYGKQSFTPESIEILKNALIEYGFFERDYQPPEIDTENNKITIGDISVADSKTLCINYVNGLNVTSEHKTTAINYINAYTGNYPLMIQHYYTKNNPLRNYSLNIWDVRNSAGTQLSYSTTSEAEGWALFNFNGTRLRRWTVGGYYGDTANFVFNLANPEAVYKWISEYPNDTSGRDMFFPQFGSYDNYKNDDLLQDDATYPDDNPFPLSYPDWMPNEFPDVDGQQLPDTYPLEYPDNLPNTQPYQDPAQNPQNDPDANAENAYDIMNNPENDPNRNTSDEPATTPDPDPQPDLEPITPQPDPEPQPDPIDPDPSPTPTPVIPTPSLPDAVNSNKLFTVYNPSGSQLDSLGGYLWDNSLIETLKKIWQNPLDGIISLIQVYVTPVAGSSHNIILGYLDSGVSAPVVTSQFVNLDCGNVSLNELRKNATDYTPYTSLQIYLPFIGITELDINECMRGIINVKYVIDVYTGTCLAQVKITRNPDTPNGAILYTFSGNCSQQIPLTSGDATGVLRSLINAAGAGLSIASGGGIGVVAGASMIGQSLTHEMFHVGHSGNLSANAGIMGQKKPYLIINRQRPYTPNNYNHYYGFPINKTVYLNNCSGFTRVKAIRLQTSATDNEREQIEQLLKEGVIF